MLERKRLLKIKEELQREGQRVFVYEQPGTGDLFTVVDPNLQLDQLEAVQREVSQLMEHGLASTPTTEPTTTEPSLPEPGDAIDAVCTTGTRASAG
jgi:hypothetical protein